MKKINYLIPIPKIAITVLIGFIDNPNYSKLYLIISILENSWAFN
jgi:hypothetical protein